jgi:activator of HSP90 ATPase
VAESIHLSYVFPTTPQRLYEAWLDGAEHTAFTRSPATVDPTVGGRFTAWDGYIQGTNLEPYRRIVQAWRTWDFPKESPDSKLEILLEEAEGGAKITLQHTTLPDGQGRGYYEGWVEYYFRRMKEYFSAAGDVEPSPAG